MRKLKSALPWIALASAIVAAGLFIGGSFYGRARIVDTGETRAVVEEALDELLAMRPESLEDPVFMRAFTAFGGSPHVAMAILVHSFASTDIEMMMTGTISMTVHGSMDGGLSGIGEGKDILVDPGSRVPAPPHPLEGISPAEFSKDQHLLLSVKSMVESANADHNDVFGSLIRAVRDPAGEMLGAIGIRYERSFWVSAVPEAAWIALIFGFALFVAIYWISIPAWTFLDARDRGEKAWLWTVFTFVGNVIALIAYLLARAPRTGKGA